MRHIYAIISLFNPNPIVVANCELIAEQVDSVILCDNSKENHQHYFSNINNSVYVYNNQNMGIPKAFNRVLIHNNWCNDDVVVFFDQDSCISGGYIRKLIAEFHRVDKKVRNLGCIGPIYYNTSNNQIEIPRLKQYVDNHTYIVDNIITSSMLMYYGTLKKIGFWNEKLFLDFADWDLCWRLKRAGYCCCLTDKVTLRHTLGEGEKHIGPIRIRIGAPQREYYQTRDALYLLAEKYVPLKMKIRLLLNVTVRPIFHIVFLSKRIERIRFIVKGIRDCFKGVHGKIES